MTRSTPRQHRAPRAGLDVLSSAADDRILAQQTLDGDHGSFALLVERYQGILFNAALRMVGDYDEATDVVQTTFVRAFRKLGSYNPRYKFFSWIYRILVNHALNTVARRKPTEPLDVQLPSGAKSPEQEFEAADLRRRIQQALMELTPDHREVIVLRHFLDLSYREIGEVVDLPEKTVKSRLFSARRHLAGLLFDGASAKAKSG